MNQLSSDLIGYGISEAWRASPLATGIMFSAREGVEFDPAPHLKLVSDSIVDAVNGDGPRFIVVSMPPRHGKSWLISRRTPEWYLGNNPAGEVLLISYGSQFAKKWGRDTRNDMLQHEDLLGFTVADDSSAADTWHTSEGGILHSAGIGAPIIGYGAGLLVMDDPIKNYAEAHSLTYRDMLLDAWKHQIRTRLYPHSVVVIVAQRWHEDDLLGHILKGADRHLWREIRLPAIWEKDEPQVVRFSSGAEWRREKGEALWPSMFGAQYFEDLKAGTSEDGEMSNETWNCMFQQEPTSSSGAGLAYSEFDEAANVMPMERDYVMPLVWCLDFNVDPMCSLICEYHEEKTYSDLITGTKSCTIRVLDEISLPNSNTFEAVAEFKARFEKLTRGRSTSLSVYGDASGEARSTSGTSTDWAIIRKELKELKNARVEYHLDASNPLVKDRVNSMNALLRNAAGIRKMFIHPRCKELVKDLKNVRWKRDSRGNATHQLDKSDPARTHLSDGLGYFIHKRFGLRASVGERAAQAV